jgi:hypothetical protein
MRTLLLFVCLGVAASPAFASRWGCEVLLCLSNPAGPTAVAECVPPIKKLWRALRKGKPFPTCDLQDGNDADGTYARRGWTHYDPCPTGTAALSDGMLAAPASTPTNRFGVLANAKGVVRGIGSGENLRLVTDSRSGGGSLPQKVCVGQTRGSAKTWNGTGYQSVALYDRLVTLNAHASPRVIDVYIDRQLAQRVRW